MATRITRVRLQGADFICATMELISDESFAARLRVVGIEFDHRFPDSGVLAFKDQIGFGRFWSLDFYPSDWPLLIGSLLRAIDSWSWGLLRPRYGAWPTVCTDAADDRRTLATIVTPLGIPNAGIGAAYFEREEENKLIAVMFVMMLFAVDSDDDLYFVPNHGQQLIKTDHHGVIHFKSLSEEGIQRAVRQLDEMGFPLPTKSPDETFKRPSWMKEE